MLGKRRVRCLTPNDYKQFVFSVFYFSVDFYSQQIKCKNGFASFSFSRYGKVPDTKEFLLVSEASPIYRSSLQIHNKLRTDTTNFT